MNASSQLHILAVLDDIMVERLRQDEKFGQQDHPDFRSNLPLVYRNAYYGMPPEVEAKFLTERRFQNGDGSFADILIEEVAEAIAAPDEKNLREELIQVAAVAAQWVEAIDRRSA